MCIFPCPWRRQSVWKPAKKCSGNYWIGSNYTWCENSCIKSKPARGALKAPKFLRRAKNRLPQANVGPAADGSSS